MKCWILVFLVVMLAGMTMTPRPAAQAATPANELVELCQELYGDVFAVPNHEPLGPCQWDMAVVNATDAGSYTRATGHGVSVGVLDTGIDVTHPDIAPNLDVGRSCSFIFSHTPTADPTDIANGDCTNKAAVRDRYGHGTHVASTIAAPINGIGIAGVAPEATLVALKVCTPAGLCFADSVAAALRYAADVGLDIVNLSLSADPYLYYCKNEAEQRAIMEEVERAVRYAQQRGVLLVVAAGNQQTDLQHPPPYELNPNRSSDTAEVIEVRNNCRVVPVELPGVLAVSATGPIGYPGYNAWIATYSNVGMSRVDVAAPGGDYFQVTGTVQDAVLGAVPGDSDTWLALEPLTADFPGLAVSEQGATYVYLNGTSMAAPHAAGVAALVKQMHPHWEPGVIKAAIQRSARQLDCPPHWEPEPYDQRTCYGHGGRTSFFGHGLVDAGASMRH